MTTGLHEAVADDLSEVAPGLLRVPLPFPPSKVNAWLLCGPDEWTLVDSGIDGTPTRAFFARVLADPGSADSRWHGSLSRISIPTMWGSPAGCTLALAPTST